MSLPCTYKDSILSNAKALYGRHRDYDVVTAANSDNQNKQTNASLVEYVSPGDTRAERLGFRVIRDQVASGWDDDLALERLLHMLKRDLYKELVERD